VQPTKASICIREKADVLVEDEVKEILACNEAGIPVILFDTRLNQGVEGEGVLRVQSWSEALAAIHQMNGQN